MRFSLRRGSICPARTGSECVGCPKVAPRCPLGGRDLPCEAPRVKSLAVRIALAAVVTLLSAELFLQAAGLVARSVASRAAPLEPGSGAVTILCVGDSHTYGLPLPREQSYPAQLEVALSERHPDQTFQVVNLGIPGMNSGYAANRLERQMLQLTPRVVVVWVGINNYWNVVEETRGDGWPASGLRPVLLYSRLFRLASIAWYTRTGHQYDPEQHGGWYDGERVPTGPRKEGADAGPPAPGLAEDLARMTEVAGTLDTPIVFVTYPMRKQRPVNRVIEQAAFELDVPIIDGSRALERAMAAGHEISDLIDLSAGPHPTGLLYAFIVEALAQEIAAVVAAGELSAR
jgi:hypothetical protein